jgi:hypothetical protein
MAKKTKTRALVFRAPSFSAPKPIVIRSTKVVKPKHKRRHGKSSSGGRGLMSKQRMGIVGGALAVGFLEKQGFMQQLPTLPLIGRTGTIGLAAYVLSDNGKNHFADEICTAALVIAAHELGSTGAIVGGEPQDVSYVAGW